MRLLITWGVCMLVSLARSQELLQNGGFESLDHWHCWSPVQCSVTSDRHSGSHGVQVQNRQANWQGPSQFISVTPGSTYQVSGYIKLQSDQGVGQTVEMEIDYQFTDNNHEYQTAASHPSARVSDGWIHLTGSFTVPSKQLNKTRIYFQGPQPGINFTVDDASVTSSGTGSGTGTGPGTGTGIGGGTAQISSECDQLRRRNIAIRVSGSNTADVKIRVLQKKKSFPFGTAVAAWAYNDASKGAYRDFIHQHFNWAVPEISLKWPLVEAQRGQKNFGPALNMINGLRSHGIKVRGHNLVWSVEQKVPDWVRQLYGDELRKVVHDHIVEVLDKTRGLLEHWDVNNENLHGQWFQNRLNDSSYNLELFNITHAADPQPKLFLNDYNVVANGASTSAYLQQAQQFKAANVGLYGLGVQCHFGDEEEPSASGVKQRLDTLAQPGLPIWATELDVKAEDENRRADFYEKALTALYCHPAVEGILLWGFWDKAHWRGAGAALVAGDNLQKSRKIPRNEIALSRCLHLTAAGRRVLELLESRWMTDETFNVAQSGTHFTLRGFHGDYEVQITQQGSTRTQTFTLGKEGYTLNISV